MNRFQFTAVNERRLRLLEKTFDGVELTADEREELERCTRDVDAYLAKHHPMATPEFQERMEEIERRLGINEQQKGE